MMIKKIKTIKKKMKTTCHGLYKNQLQELAMDLLEETLQKVKEESKFPLVNSLRMCLSLLITFQLTGWAKSKESGRDPLKLKVNDQACGDLKVSPSMEQTKVVLEIAG